jgi:hypothetical protein
MILEFVSVFWCYWTLSEHVDDTWGLVSAWWWYATRKSVHVDDTWPSVHLTVTDFINKPQRPSCHFYFALSLAAVTNAPLVLDTDDRQVSVQFLSLHLSTAGLSHRRPEVHPVATAVVGPAIERTAGLYETLVHPVPRIGGVNPQVATCWLFVNLLTERHLHPHRWSVRK